MSSNRLTLAASILLAMSLAPLPRVQAAFSGKMKVDIDTAKGQVLATTEGWQLCITYKVELKYVPCDDHMHLVFFVQEDDYALRDLKGRPVRIVVPLEHPYKASDTKRKFKGTFTVPLPDGSFSCPDHLYLMSRVVRVADRRICANKRKSIKYDVPHAHDFYLGVGVSVGF